MAGLEIAFAAISVAAVVAIAYFLHTCSRDATPIPPMTTPPGTAEEATAGGDVELGTGMDEAAIRALPKVVVHGGDASSSAEASCAVCLRNYDRGDVLRVLPGCEHFRTEGVYHRQHPRYYSFGINNRIQRVVHSGPKYITIQQRYDRTDTTDSGMYVPKINELTN